MPKSIHLFIFLIVTCSFLVCLYYNEIEKNVSRRFGPHLLGSNLRNLRSSEDISALTGAALSNVTPSASVQHGDEYQNNTALAYYSANTKNANVSSAETIHLAVIFCTNVICVSILILFLQNWIALKWIPKWDYDF